MTLLRSIPFPTGAAAREAERRALAEWGLLRYRGKTGFSFSDTEVFVPDVLGYARQKAV